MTDQHRATPKQWEFVEICSKEGRIPWSTAVCILELRARIEALEATQHAHADLSHLSDAEREQIYAEMAKPAAWRPLETETTYGSEAAAAAAQILRAPMVVEGTFDHGGETYRFKANATPERDPAMLKLRARTEALEAAQVYQFRSATEKVPTTRLYSYSVGLAKPLDELGQGHTLVSPEPASAEAQPGGSLLERVANAIYNVPHDSAAEARAAIREVAAWLSEHTDDDASAYWAARLEQEADRG